MPRYKRVNHGTFPTAEDGWREVAAVRGDGASWWRVFYSSTYPDWHRWKVALDGQHNGKANYWFGFHRKGARPHVQHALLKENLPTVFPTVEEVRRSLTGPDAPYVPPAVPVPATKKVRGEFPNLGEGWHKLTVVEDGAGVPWHVFFSGRNSVWDLWRVVAEGEVDFRANYAFSCRKGGAAGAVEHAHHKQLRDYRPEVFAEVELLRAQVTGADDLV